MNCGMEDQSPLEKETQRGIAPGVVVEKERSPSNGINCGLWRDETDRQTDLMGQ